MTLHWPRAAFMVGILIPNKCAESVVAAFERNHEIVREVLPKGTSFDGLSQPQADLLFSHVNADVRKSMNDRTPYDVFEFLYGAGACARLRRCFATCPSNRCRDSSAHLARGICFYARSRLSASSSKLIYGIIRGHG